MAAFLMRPVKFLAWLITFLAMTVVGIWGTLALFCAGPADATLRQGVSLALAAWSLLLLVGWCRRGWRRPALLAQMATLALLMLWWQSLHPSNERDWQADVAILPYATSEGQRVTVHNIRNFAYRSETDYTPAYYDRTFDLQRLQGVDLVAVYWMGPAIAHIFLSFAFDNDQHLAISIETRKEKGEGYSTLKGFFRQYELYYVVADERDVIRLRTNYRHDPPEDVYVYRLGGDIEKGRRLFLEYMRQINALKEQPSFYNSLTTNCTTSIWLNSKVNQTHLPLHWKVLASGYVPEYLYENGRLQSDGLSFAELQQRAHVNARAQAADQASDFSRRIRTQ